ncbi:unnamed protein product [Lampetra fluviatilis]
MTKGWERLEGRIDRLTDAVPQLVVQLAGEEERPGAVEMVAGEPAVGAVRSTAAEAREPGMLGAVGAAGAPSPETAPVARERALDRIHRLGPFKEFVAAGGNWGVFTRRGGGSTDIIVGSPVCAGTRRNEPADLSGGTYRRGPGERRLHLLPKLQNKGHHRRGLDHRGSSRRQQRAAGRSGGSCPRVYGAQRDDSATTSGMGAERVDRDATAGSTHHLPSLRPAQAHRTWMQEPLQSATTASTSSSAPAALQHQDRA